MNNRSDRFITGNTKVYVMNNIKHEVGKYPSLEQLNYGAHYISELYDDKNVRSGEISVVGCYLPDERNEKSLKEEGILHFRKTLPIDTFKKPYEMYEITFDNGFEFECSAYVSFMMENGQYIMAEDLVPGIRIHENVVKWHDAKNGIWIDSPMKRFFEFHTFGGIHVEKVIKVEYPNKYDKPLYQAWVGDNTDTTVPSFGIVEEEKFSANENSFKIIYIQNNLLYKPCVY